MPRSSLKQRKRGFDPHAFEFTGEEAVQADKAAKARPTFRRKKVSILSALPDAPNPFTALAERPLLTLKNAEDCREASGADNEHGPMPVSRRFRQPLGVARRETKRRQAGREKLAPRIKRKGVKRKATLKANVSPSVNREITPEPPVPSFLSATQESSEASSALRRSGRKRYRTAKALQVYEESLKKPRMQTRRRSDQDVDPKTGVEGQGAVPVSVSASIVPFKEENNRSKTEANHHLVHEEGGELHPRRLEQTDLPPEFGTEDEPNDEESSETPKDPLIENNSDSNASRINIKAHSATQNMTDALIGHQNESRHLHSPTKDDDIGEGQTQNLEPRSSIPKPLIVDRIEEQSAGLRQELTESKSSGPECGVSDQKTRADSRNNMRVHAQEKKFHNSQKHGDDTAQDVGSEPSPIKTEANAVETDQNSSVFVSPITPAQPTKPGLGYTSDPRAAKEAMKNKPDEKSLLQGTGIMESSSEKLTSVTTAIQSSKSPNATCIASGFDGQPGCTNTTTRKSETQSSASPNDEDCGRIEEQNLPLADKASSRSPEMCTIVLPQSENITLPGVAESPTEMFDDSVISFGKPGMQNGEKSAHGYELNEKSTAENVPKSAESLDSVRPSEPKICSRSGTEIPGESSKDTIQSAQKNGEGDAPGMKTDVPTTMMRSERESQSDCSLEAMQEKAFPSDLPHKNSPGENEGMQSGQEIHTKFSPSHPKQIDLEKPHKSIASTMLTKRKLDGECNVPFTTTNVGEKENAQISQPPLQDSRKSKQTFSKRVRFTEPEKSGLPSMERKGISDIMKMRLRKARRRQLTPLAPHGVTVMTIRGSDLNEKERRVFLDELQYLLDGIFKPSGKAERKSPQLESQLISKTLISLTQLLTRKSREMKPSVEDENDSALIQILSTQPSLFRSIVSRLCGVFGKSRSIDAMLAAVFVLIFRATPKLLLVSATELDILLNAFFRSSAAALKEDEVEGSRRSSAVKGTKGIDAKKRRGRLAKRFEESKVESSVLSALNKVMEEASIAEEEFSGFKNEAVAASHLIGTALSLVMCFHGNLRSVMRENRRLDKVVAVLYSCEKLMVQKVDSSCEEKKLQFVHNEAPTAWVVLGASLKILEFAILDRVCQARTARESRLCAIVVDVIRSVECLREGMFGSEWILSAALRVAINLCHGFGEASRQFVKRKGHELVLKWVAKECRVAGLLSGEEEHLCTDGVNESFDVRVLCLALLATIVDQERDVCDQFHTMNVDGFKRRKAGGLEIATEVLRAAEMILEADDLESESNDFVEERRRRAPDALARTQHAERAEIMLEKKITIGYASLLLGALVQENVKNRKMAEDLIPSNNLVGVAAVLTGFLEFHHEVGIISGSMDRMYARIIDSLVKPFQGKGAPVVEDGASWEVGRDGNCEREDISISLKAECT